MSEGPVTPGVPVGTPTIPVVTKSQWAPKEWIQVAQLAALVGLMYLLATGKTTMDQVDRYLPFLIGQQQQLPANPSTPGVIVKPNVVGPGPSPSTITLDDVNKAIENNNAKILNDFGKLLDEKLKAFE